MKKIPPVLEKILIERYYSQDLRLVGTEKDDLFDSDTLESDPINRETTELRLAGTEKDPNFTPKKSQVSVVPGQPRPVQIVTPEGDTIYRLPKNLNPDFFTFGKALKGLATSYPGFLLGDEIGREAAEEWGIPGESEKRPWGMPSGQEALGFATGVAAADMVTPFLTTAPTMISSGSGVVPALTTATLEGGAALANPWGIVIAGLPLAGYGIWKGLSKLGEYGVTKNLTPTQRKYYDEAKAEQEKREKMAEIKRLRAVAAAEQLRRKKMEMQPDDDFFTKMGKALGQGSMSYHP